VRSRCHSRATIDPARIGSEDLLRMGRLWGCLLANFHLRGLRALKADVSSAARDLAADARSAKDLARTSWELAAFTDKAHHAFGALAKAWE
jgi:hypothetical protein